MSSRTRERPERPANEADQAEAFAGGGAHQRSNEEPAMASNSAQEKWAQVSWLPLEPGPRTAAGGGPIAASSDGSEDASRQERLVGAVGLLLAAKPLVTPMPLPRATEPRG